jgi:hypothetical protein
MRRLIILMVALVTLAGCGGAAEPTAIPTSSAPPIAAVGERVESAGVAFTVVSAERKTEMGGMGAQAKEGVAYLLVEVLIENVGAGDKFTTSPSGMRVRDGSGIEFPANYFAPEPQWKGGGFMLQGTKERGNLAWEIKADAKDVVLTYAPGGTPRPGPFRVAMP